MTRSALKSSLENASFRILFQILFRCVTFVLNAWVLRVVGTEVFGIMNVRLLLLESTLIFLCKEPCMRACQTNTKFIHWPQIINQIWLTVPACIVLSIPILYIWLYKLSSINDDLVDQYNLACYLMTLSCVIEQITNSPFLVATTYGFFKLLIFIDTSQIALRTITFVTLLIMNQNAPILAFGIAQIVSLCYNCLALYIFFWWYIKQIKKKRAQNELDNQLNNDAHMQCNEINKDENQNQDLFMKLINLTNYDQLFDHMDDFKFKSIKELLPGFMTNDKNVFSKSCGLLTFSFVKQTVVKQVLTEGERYVMTLSPVLSLDEQATYDIVNNLGSLAARFIFRPIEDSSYFYFTQMIQRDKPLVEQDKKHVEESTQVLTYLFNVVTSVGLFGLVFGQSYSATLLYLYGGKILTSSPLPVILLRCHCLAILLIAINGVTEGYVFATMTSKQIDRYNYIMVAFSITFLLLSYLFTYLFGSVGFIFANCLNMLARIVHSLHYILAQYENIPLNPLFGYIPKFKFSLALILSAFITKLSEAYFYPSSIIIHICIGGVCVVVTLLMWILENRDLIHLARDKYFPKKTKIN